MWTRASAELLTKGARVRNLDGGWYTPLTRDDEDFEGEKGQTMLPPLCEGKVWLIECRSEYANFVHVYLYDDGETAWCTYNTEAPEDMDLLEVWVEKTNNA